MQEKEIEKYLRVQVELRGGKAYKFVSPGNAGVPDRIVVFPNGNLVFVETKKGKYGNVSAIQKFRINELLKLGQRVVVLNSTEEIREFLKEEDKL
jgi:DNA-binding beta-propeller fold protein YncE